MVYFKIVLASKRVVLDGKERFQMLFPQKNLMQMYKHAQKLCSSHVLVRKPTLHGNE